MCTYHRQHAVHWSIGMRSHAFALSAMQGQAASGQGQQQGQAASSKPSAAEQTGMPAVAAVDGMGADQGAPQRKRKWRYFWAEGNREAS
jgi:hypothetical protein